MDTSGDKGERFGANKSQSSNDGDDDEFERLQQEEERKLEAAIQQAATPLVQRDGTEGQDTISFHDDSMKTKKHNISNNVGDRSHMNLSKDFDLSQIQVKHDVSRIDTSGIRDKIDAIEKATRQNNKSSFVRQSNGSEMPDITDISDLHALRNNYLEKSNTS